MYAAYSRNTEASARDRLAELRAAERREAELRRQERQATADRARELALQRAALCVEYPKHSYRAIEAMAFRIFKVSRRELNGQSRHHYICFARQFVMFWTSRLSGLSDSQIGRLMGGRDNTTVIHGKRAYVAKRAKQGRTLRAVR